ncbi:hypothetical protein ABPG72_015450 [Tetrahymena utriculariae]
MINTPELIIVKRPQLKQNFNYLNSYLGMDWKQYSYESKKINGMYQFEDYKAYVLHIEMENSFELVIKNIKHKIINLKNLSRFFKYIFVQSFLRQSGQNLQQFNFKITLEVNSIQEFETVKKFGGIFGIIIIFPQYLRYLFYENSAFVFRTIDLCFNSKFEEFFTPLLNHEISLCLKKGKKQINIAFTQNVKDCQQITIRDWCNSVTIGD